MKQNPDFRNWTVLELGLGCSTSYVTWKKSLSGDSVLQEGRSGKYPEWRRPAGLSVVVEISQIRTSQYGGHSPHMWMSRT